MSALTGHELRIAELSRELSGIGAAYTACQGTRQQAIFLEAQIIKHRISISLLRSRLQQPLPVPH
jgi:hypothetical protein